MADPRREMGTGRGHRKRISGNEHDRHQPRAPLPESGARSQRADEPPIEYQVRSSAVSGSSGISSHEHRPRHHHVSNHESSSSRRVEATRGIQENPGRLHHTRPIQSDMGLLEQKRMRHDVEDARPRAAAIEGSETSHHEHRPRQQHSSGRDSSSLHRSETSQGAQRNTDRSLGVRPSATDTALLEHKRVERRAERPREPMAIPGPSGTSNQEQRPREHHGGGCDASSSRRVEAIQRDRSHPDLTQRSRHSRTDIALLEQQRTKRDTGDPRYLKSVPGSSGMSSQEQRLRQSRGDSSDASSSYRIGAHEGVHRSIENPHQTKAAPGSSGIYNQEQRSRQHHSGDARLSHRVDTVRAPQLTGSNAGTQSQTPTAALTGITTQENKPRQDLVRARDAYRGVRINPELLYTRPPSLTSKKGELGEPVQLQANYFKLLSTTDWCLYKYHVEFIPEEDRTFVRKGMVKVHKETLGGYIYDGSILYTSHKLPQPLEVQSKRKSDDEVITMKIHFVGDIVKGDEHYLQFFNIIMRKCLEYLNLQLAGRNHYDAASRIEVTQYHLQLWPGYETAIRQHENNILMRCEVIHKVMRLQTMLDILYECYHRHGSHGYQDQYKMKVIGLTVLTGYNNHTYRVDDVDFDVKPESTFSRKGEDITYKDYYYNRYNIRITDLGQPMLISRSSARDRRAGLAEMVYLVPELCRATGLTDEMRNNFQMMRALSDHTRVNPYHRIQKLLNFNQRLQHQPQVVRELSEWNLRLDTKLVNVPGRQCPEIRIGFHNPHVNNVSAGDQADWTTHCRSMQMHRTGALDNWWIIVPREHEQNTDKFIGIMRSSVRDMNFPISTPEKRIIDDGEASSYLYEINEILRRTDPNVIMCIVPNNRADRYAAIKKKCCTDHTVATQCLLIKNLTSRGVQSIATKVAIQLNCKIGGAPWTVIIPLSTTMIVGLDVCRDTISKNRYFGALVAAMDQHCTKYFSVVTAHTSIEELSENLAGMMEKAIVAYKSANGTLPTTVVVYRDGVSDGELPYVYEHEVEHVKARLEALYGELPCKLAYVVVTKRSTTRLFLGRNNPRPGTIVDDVVTLPNKYDFYIVSQHVRQGTVTPTAYNILFNTTTLTPARFQELSYRLTHMYFNWSGTIRVPAPCQLANKLASLVSQSLHVTPHPNLANILFYL